MDYSKELQLAFIRLTLNVSRDFTVSSHSPREISHAIYAILFPYEFDHKQFLYADVSVTSS